MRCLLCLIFATNFLFVANAALAQEAETARALFFKAEKKWLQAKSLQFRVEATTQETVEKKPRESKDSCELFMAQGNKVRLDLGPESSLFGAPGSWISDGKQTRFLVQKKTFDEGVAPENLNENVVKTFHGAGIRGFGLVMIGLLHNRDSAKPLDLKIKLGDFKLGRQEKVGSRLAQSLSYTFSAPGKEVPDKKDELTTIKVTLWLDQETLLPLKRQIFYEDEDRKSAVTEIYSGFRIDAALEAKLFELRGK